MVARLRRHRVKPGGGEAGAPPDRTVLSGSVSPPPHWASGDIVRRLWWSYLGWLCTRWLTLRVYGTDLRARAIPPRCSWGVLVVANHISQLDQVGGGIKAVDMKGTG